jgi:hypothetical protein
MWQINYMSLYQIKDGLAAPAIVFGGMLKSSYWAVVRMLRVNVCFMMSLLKMLRGQPPAKPATALSAKLDCGLLCFPAPQRELLIIQVLVALLLDVDDFGDPAALFHNPLGTENGIFVMVVPIDTVLAFDKVGVFDYPPAITVTDTGNVPGGGVSSGYCLSQLNCLGHGASLKRR